MKVSRNPYNGEKLFQFKDLKDNELEKKLQQADEAFQFWRKTAFGERSKRMLKVAEELKGNTDTYAKIITQEMGKPISQSVAEIEKCAWVCEYYAKNAKIQLQDEVIETDADESFVRYEPLGVVLAIMPWNYPFWQVFRFAAPNLMAGNVGMLKHASNVMKCGEVIQEIFENAGFPKGCFQNLVVGSEKISAILQDDRVKAVTLTGSKPAGAAVASKAGEHIKKSVLELGGSNALIVFSDADLEKTVATCVQARFQNTGQSCIAGKRLLVQADIADDFMKKFITKVKELKSGDTMDNDTYIGVLAREDLAQDIERQVNASLNMGAKLKLGGKRNGTYFEPTVLSEVSPKMPMFKEETFGPAIGITTFDTDEEAVQLSNASAFGLGVSIFTSDMKKAKKLAPQFAEGAVFVNELVKSDPRLPFGGIKISGYGRELSAHGIKEFMNKKTVYLKK
ncbi:MAG TPA: NAD-dependent succinate-semialdehyde dehydrogenase [Pricia sp.]|nr:NAD-dependent succinate-semialdehyde dehydrogenase [Pricia sp.]